MNKLATYTFLPWLRQGIANQISAQIGSRAVIPIDINISGIKVDGSGDQTATVSKEVQIYGPGDIIGIDKKAIVKEEPKNWITNFEPNYLPYIEFYDEDLPWRYAPLKNPNNHRLLPWLALVVLKENEFEDGKLKDKPLGFITLGSNAKLHKADQTWAWSHVHINKDLIDPGFRSTDTPNIASALESLLNKNPDMAYSRIVCPRKLVEKEAYHAFLVPVFESGRLAGLGEDPTGVAASDLAWDASVNLDGKQMPYYHRWYFRTGTVGDFEYLVRLLEPKPVDSRVGKRDMDVQTPGANLKGLRDDAGTDEKDKLHGILKLGGALKVPDIYYTDKEFEEVEKYRNWSTLNGEQDYPHPFQKNIAAFINLTDSYETEEAITVNADAPIEQEIAAIDVDTDYDIQNNPDPLITAPLYGRWHALTNRLLKERGNSTDISPNDNWTHDLNLDPRWRVAAGMGTKIVQKNQENYMKAAWDQIGDVLEANKRIREAQLAQAAALIWWNKHLLPLKEKRPNRWLNVASPMHARIISTGFTVAHQKKESRLTTASTSVNMRKLLRPRGKLVKRVNFDEGRNLDNLITRINEGEVSAALPRPAPEGAQSLNDIAEAAKPKVPDFILDWLNRFPWLKWLMLLLALIILLLIIIFPPSGSLMTIAGVIILGLIYLFIKLNKWQKEADNATDLLPENQTPESIDELPKNPDFRLSTPEEKFTPKKGNTDSEEGKLFKDALKDVNFVLQQSAKISELPERPALNIIGVNETVFEGIRPTLTIPRWVFDSVVLPPLVTRQLREQFVEAMVYPKIDVPMYKPLVDHSSELFLPNLNYIDQNSISLLETNQKFIESYLIGLNHEFARELLWREYPTDQRGSYFRQFWDASGYIDPEPVTLASIKARINVILADRYVYDLKEFIEKLEEDGAAADLELQEEAYQAVLSEELKDIKPIHRWKKRSNLGEHDNRELPGDTEEEVVLVIRGELLKKYPTAVIYAHRAVWNYQKDEDDNFILDENGDKIIDTKAERSLASIPADQEDNPPQDIIKSSLYEAKVDPDIYFFGFDLTVCEAQGGTGKEDEAVEPLCADKISWDDPGWFFVIKERPGEPRFGLDVRDADVTLNDIKLWNDLSWDHVTPAVADGGYLEMPGAATEIPLQALNLDGTEQEKAEQKAEDANFSWNEEMNSAELAYILYQVPVLVAVHGTEMLPTNPT